MTVNVNAADTNGDKKTFDSIDQLCFLFRSNLNYNLSHLSLCSGVRAVYVFRHSSMFTFNIAFPLLHSCTSLLSILWILLTHMYAHIHTHTHTRT